MTSEIAGACDHIVAAAVNGLYQGSLVAVFVALGLRLLGHTNAATRHATWFATLVLIACLIPAHCLRDCCISARPSPPGLRQTGTMTAAPAPSHWRPPRDDEPTSASPPSSSSPLISLSSSPSFPQEERGEERRVLLSGPWTDLGWGRNSQPTHGEDVLFSLPMDGHSFATHTAGAFPRDRVAAQLTLPNRSGATTDNENRQSVLDSSASVREVESGWRLERVFKPAAWTFAPGQWVPRQTSVVVLAGWLAVVILNAFRLFRRFSQIRTLKANAVPAGEDLAALFERLRRQLGVSRAVALKVSPMPRSPVLLGFLHPVVLVPVAQGADAAETEAILRHELAHARRWDDWANLVQRLVQGILFFHPAIWWISRHLSIQREIACDDYVLQQGSHPRAYALLLADLASRIRTGRPLLAPGVSASKSQLQERINMILNQHRNTSPRLAKSRLGFITAAAALLAAFAIYSAPRLVLAQTPTPSPSPDNVGTASTPPHSPAAPTAEPAPPGPPHAPPPTSALPRHPTPPTPPAVEPGAKDKPRALSERAPEPVPVPAPAAPAPPGMVPAPPDAAHAPQAVVVPRPPRPAFAPPPEAALEQRLQRLEKMVQSLLEERDPNRSSNDRFYRELPPPEVRRERELLLKQYPDATSRDAARASERARREFRNAEEALKLEQEREVRGKHREQFARQLEELHKQRQVLEREMENLQRQIEHLEQEQKKLQDEQKRRSDLLEEQAADTERRALLDESIPVKK